MKNSQFQENESRDPEFTDPFLAGVRVKRWDWRRKLVRWQSTGTHLRGSGGGNWRNRGSVYPKATNIRYGVLGLVVEYEGFAWLLVIGLLLLLSWVSMRVIHGKDDGGSNRKRSGKRGSTRRRKSIKRGPRPKK